MLETAMKGKTKTDFDDVAWILSLILCLKLLVPTSSHVLGWNYLGYVDNLNEMKKYNWADFIMEGLMGSIRKANNNSKHVSGCVMILLVSILFHLSLLYYWC